MNNLSTTTTIKARLQVSCMVSAFLFALTFMNSSPTLRAQSPDTPGQRPSFVPLVQVQTQDYSVARKEFHTKLLRKGQAPQAWKPLDLPEGVAEIEYSSGGLRLKAWVNRPPANDKHKRPAVLFLHGGHAFDLGDWQMSQPFRDAGFIVMTPMLRGENGQPGEFSLFYDELDDVIAAAEYLRRQPFISSDQVFVAGHSVGGTMAMLAAQAYKHFRAAASFSGSPDQVLFVKYAPGVRDQVPFDPADARELQMRSPLAFAASFKCPIRIYYGSEETHFDLTSKRTAELATANKLDAQAVKVEGDHMSEVPKAMELSIEFFRQTTLAKTKPTADVQRPPSFPR